MGGRTKQLLVHRSFGLCVAYLVFGWRVVFRSRYDGMSQFQSNDDDLSLSQSNTNFNDRRARSLYETPEQKNKNRRFDRMD